MKPVLLSLSVIYLISAFPLNSHAADKKPVFLYSRYFNAVGEARYLPDGNYKEVLERLGRDFEVRVNDKPLTADNLKGVDVVMVANPSDKAVRNNPAPHHANEQDIREITQYVQTGGGFIIMGNQENHNLEVTDMNKLLQRFGLQFTNLYTDAKKLTLPKEAPAIGGLRWAYYTGNLLLLDQANSAHPFPIVSNDLKQKPEKGERDQKGVLLAGSTPGKGRVLGVTDAGWICDWALSEEGVGGVAIKGQDNWEMFRRLALWAAGR